MESTNLNTLVKEFLSFRKFDFESNVIIRGKNDKTVEFSYLVHGTTDNQTNLSGKIGVIVKDWARSCGYNVILEAERLQESSGLSKVMVVANQFSGTARELAEKLGIITLTNGELISIKSMYGKQFSFDA
ncbi:MAG: restriction endonuclease [Candidatus Hodarchaeota archaeon]